MSARASKKSSKLSRWLEIVQIISTIFASLELPQTVTNKFVDVLGDKEMIPSANELKKVEKSLRNLGVGLTSNPPISIDRKTNAALRELIPKG